MKNNLVLYSGTYLNKGGAAIAYGTLKVLKEIGLGVKYSIDPDIFPEAYFKDFDLIPIYRYSNILTEKPISSINFKDTIKPFIYCWLKSYSSQIRQLRGNNIWHIGDSPFSDHRSVFSVIGQVFALDTLRKALNGKIVIGGISLEYPRTEVGRGVLKRFFKKVDHIFIRGKETQHHLYKLDVPINKMTSICDFAFHLNEDHSSKVEQYGDIIKKNNRPKVALVLRDYSQGKERENYIRNLNDLILKLKKSFEIYYIPTAYSFFLPENDLFFIEQVINKKNVINVRDFTPSEIIALLSYFDIVISTRLHGAVLGSLAHVPTIHLYEGRKGIEVLEDVYGKELLPLVKLSDFSMDHGYQIVINLTEKLIENKTDISCAMKDIIASVREESVAKINHFFNKNS